jgi:NAD(P)-dependent dehydrogenase (short-subunit alcohol dehydrogenase family)
MRGNYEMPEDEGQRALLLAQQIAIITGAAKGIGRGIAVEMAQEGADVVLADIDEEGMNETKRIISAHGRRCLSVHTNIQEIEQGRRLVDTVLQQFGKVDILVNNAGVNTSGARHILEISPESYDRVLHTNLRAPFFLSQYMAQKMIESKTQGSLLFTSSTHARVISMQPAYSASKAALEMFVREAALEMAEYGIRVNAVAPGWIAVRDEVERTNPFIPLGYTGDPRDIAQAMVFLASRHASYITGQILTVDGGFSLTHSHYWFEKGSFKRK